MGRGDLIGRGRTSSCPRISRPAPEAAGTRRPVRPGGKTQRFTTKGLRVMKSGRAGNRSG